MARTRNYPSKYFEYTSKPNIGFWNRFKREKGLQKTIETHEELVRIHDLMINALNDEKVRAGLEKGEVPEEISEYRAKKFTAVLKAFTAGFGVGAITSTAVYYSTAPDVNPDFVNRVSAAWGPEAAAMAAAFSWAILGIAGGIAGAHAAYPLFAKGVRATPPETKALSRLLTESESDMLTRNDISELVGQLERSKIQHMKELSKLRARRYAPR